MEQTKICLACGVVEPSMLTETGGHVIPGSIPDHCGPVITAGDLFDRYEGLREAYGALVAYANCVRNRHGSACQDQMYDNALSFNQEVVRARGVASLTEAANP